MGPEPQGARFTRRTGVWRVRLLPGWDAVEDLLTFALISREPRREDGPSAVWTVTEVPRPLTANLEAFRRETEKAMTARGVTVSRSSTLTPLSRPGRPLVDFQLRYAGPEDRAMVAEQIWANTGAGALMFTLIVEGRRHGGERERLLAVPRSLELPSVGAT